MAITLSKGSGPAVDMTKHRGAHVDLAKRFDKAGISLSKRGLDGIRAQAVLSLDHSGSMFHLYRSGAVQAIVERALGFALQIDADGVIPVYAFDSKLWPSVDVGIEDDPAKQVLTYRDVVNQHIWRRNDMGGTVMESMIRNATDIARVSDAPVFHIIVGDGSPSDRGRTTKAVIESADYPIFHKFLAVEEVDYLQELDDIPSSKRTLDNVDAKFLTDVTSMSDLAFADAMTEEWDTFLGAAQRASIIV